MLKRENDELKKELGEIKRGMKSIDDIFEKISPD